MKRRPLTAARRHRLLVASALTGVLALSSASCSTGTDAGIDKARSAGSAASADAAAEAGKGTDPTGNAPVEQGGTQTSWSAAVETAEKSVPGGKATDVELDDGVWEVDVMTSEPRVHNVAVDATTGALLGSRADQMPEQARSYLKIALGKLAAATVPRTDAAATALKAAGKGYVSEVSIQGTESRPLWQIDVRDGSIRHEIDVDATSGAAVRHDKEQDDGDERRRSSDSRTGGGDSATRAPSQGEVRERSHDFGKDEYDWSRHVPR
ncbi:PepSY domain-containing protein [Streptomyces sp. IBSNAI002]|uniref:PepSY domain-containing protein n=1 Tax=Streptomyces sp. IBSNAI002 TaxID=3457500 RepID=UPI003FD3E277